MKNKKHIYMLLIFLVFLLTISAASAAEDTASDITSIDDDEIIALEETPVENNLNEANEELILEENNEGILNVEDDTVPLSKTPGNFKDLESLINNNSDPEITLDRDYVYSESDGLSGGVTINRGVTINGNGFTLNGDVKARIFIVTNSSVVFKNINFLGGRSPNGQSGGAILGECTAINCTFTSNQAYYGNGGAMNGGTAINCTFTNNNAWGDENTGNGGAMNGGTAINCTFTSNQGKIGGAMYNGVARNCTFTSNYGQYGGGAMCNSIAVNSHFENNTIYDDGFEDPHNAIYNTFALNCTFVNNGWDSESHVTNHASLDIKNITGYVADNNRLDIDLIGDNGKINDIGVTILVYQNEELIKTVNIGSGMFWGIDLPQGNYTAIASVDNIPEIESVNFTINLSKSPTSIIADDISSIYTSESYLYVTLQDGIYGTLRPVVSSGVSVDIDGNISNYTTNNIGLISIPLKDLSIGTHTATIIFKNHTLYEDANKTVTITITKIPTVIECEDPYITIYNTSEYFAIRVTDIFGNPLSVLSIEIDLIPDDYFITNDDGYAYVHPKYLQRLAVGNHTAKITCPGTTWDIYGPAETKTINIVIEKQKAFVNTANLTTTYNSDDKITATLVNEQGNPISGANLTVDLFEGETFISDENGRIEVPINTLAAGRYETKIIFNGSENYEYAGYLIFVTINKDSTQVFAENVTTSADIAKDFTITLKDSQNRTVSNAQITVFMEDFVNKTTDANGQVIISTEGMGINRYTVFIFFNGNENYTGSSAKASIEITKATPILTVEDCSVNWGNPATVNITVKDKDGNPVSGIAKVSVGGYEDLGYEYYIPIDETGKGQARFIAELIPRAYRIYAVFLANDNYEGAEDDCLLIIYESNKLNLEISANEAVFGEDTILTVKATDGRNKSVNIRKVNVTIGEETKEFDVEDLAVNLGKLAVGSTPIQVIPIHEYYDPVSVNLNVTVIPATPELTVTPRDAGVTIEAKGNGNPISGTAKIYIDGDTENPMTVEIDETGTITVPLNDLSKGNHAVEVVFTNENYTTAKRTVTVNVPKGTPVLKVTGTTVELGDYATVTIKITDEDNNPIRGTVIVTVDCDGDIVNDVVELDENGAGQAKLLIIGVPGSYNIIAKFIGDDNFASVINDTEKVTIIESDDISFNAQVNEGITEITITDAKNEDTGEAVNGTIEAKLFKGYDEIELGNFSVNKGQGTVMIPEGLEPGIYNAVLILRTDDDKIAINSVAFTIKTKDTVISITSKDIKYGEKAMISFTLTDVKGNNLDGILTVSVGNQNKTVNVTDGKGSIEISELNAGNYTVIADFAGNENYTASSNYSKFNVAKIGSQIICENMTVTAVDVATDGRVGKYFTITLKDKNGKPLANKAIQIGFNGNVYDRVTDENGSAKLQINLKYAGTYTFAVSYLGDDNYEGSFVVAKITVKSQKGSLTVPAKSYKANAKTKSLTATFRSASGKLVKGKKVTFTVNGKTYTATTNAKGVATVKVSLNKKGSYKFTAKFTGDKTYAAISKTGKLTIK